MNKKYTKFTITFIFIFLPMFFLTSCATKVRYTVTRPAQLDLNGAKTIAVLPIKPYDFITYTNTTSNLDFVLSSFFSAFDNAPYEEKRAISYLQTNIENGLYESPYIDLVSADSVQKSLEKGYLNPADIYFTGEVTYYHVHDGVERVREQVTSDSKDSSGKKLKKYVIVEYFYREVNFTLKYQIVDSSNNKILSYNQISINETSSRKDRIRDVPTAFEMIKPELSSAVNKILKELQPYVLRKSVTLLKDKSKNQQMKTAYKLADDEKLFESYELFSQIYEETNLFEAGFNAALLQIPMGNLQKAENLMVQLKNSTHDSRCDSALNDIRYELTQKQLFESQIEEKSQYID